MSYARLAQNAFADLGRGGDNQLIHATPGEVMLPPEFQAMNPELMAKLTHAIQKMGMDPTDFVVGNDDEPNPFTGLEEHGFWKKLKKAFKKSILPTVGSIVGGAAGQYLGIGASLGSGLSAGLGSYAGSGDALNAALSGVGAYAGSEFLGPELGLEGNFLGASAGSQAGGAIGAFGASMLGNAFISSDSGDSGLSIDAPSANLPAAATVPAINTTTTTNTPLPSTGSGVNSLSPIKYLDMVKNRDTGQYEYAYISPFGSSLARAGDTGVYRI